MTNYIPMPTRRPVQVREYPVCSFAKTMEIINSRCGDVHISEKHGVGSNKVIFLPEATRELEVMISYGRRSPMNASEQKYVGYGHFLKDENGFLIVVVKHLIEIQTMNRTSIGASNLGPNGEYNPGLDFLEYHRDEFLKTETKYNNDAFGYLVDPFLKLCGSSEFVLEGHTHPDLGVFYSVTDKISGGARAASLPICIFVCDPIRKKMLGSIGKEFSEAEILVYSRKETCKKDLNGEKCLTPPVDYFVNFVNQCLNSPDYSGKMKLSTCLNGKERLRVNLVIPKGENEKR